MRWPRRTSGQPCGRPESSKPCGPTGRGCPATTISNRTSALAQSKRFAINLDIGHFVAAGFDPVDYITKNHDRITNLHIKDRKKDQGDNTAWGTGDTPIRDVLQLLKREGWPIRAYVEYEHRGTAGPVEEVKTCFAYAKQVLA